VTVASEFSSAAMLDIAAARTAATKIPIRPMGKKRSTKYGIT